jgi:hypothetical protein
VPAAPTSTSTVWPSKAGAGGADIDEHGVAEQLVSQGAGEGVAKRAVAISSTVPSGSIGSSWGGAICVEFQRLGPNAGGCAGRGLGGCWSCVVCVRLVTGTALGGVGPRSAFAVSDRRCATRVLRPGWSSGGIL